MNKDVAANSMKEQALALFRENRLVEAGKLFAEICTIDPSDAEAWFKLGIINFELNTLLQAETCFRKVVELRPSLDSAKKDFLGRPGFSFSGGPKNTMSSMMKQLPLIRSCCGLHRISGSIRTSE